MKHPNDLCMKEAQILECSGLKHLKVSEQVHVHVLKHPSIFPAKITTRQKYGNLKSKKLVKM